jgi:MFS family permease
MPAFQAFCFLDGLMFTKSASDPAAHVYDGQDAGMTATEIRASASLASIFALRMLGLFLILPVFSIYAKTLPGGDSAFLAGLAMGIYGLTQACGQIPLGMASDKYGRKPIIVLGLAVFAIGSFVAASTDDLRWIIFGRALQGAGAISAAVTAFIADATRDEHRTKAMAMVGGSIALTFAGSLILSPMLYEKVGMGGMFNLTGVLALIAIFVVIFIVPSAPVQLVARVRMSEVLKHVGLLRLNAGVFALHFVMMAMFIVVPSVLVKVADLPVSSHWKVYLPVVLISFIFMLPPIFVGERQGKMKQVFICAISLLLLVQIGMWVFMQRYSSIAPLHWSFLVGLLLLFFIAFNILEACQPSLVSRIAPTGGKGAALGVYNTLQAFGLFCGPSVGGWVSDHFGAAAVFGMSTFLTLAWLIIASKMQNLPRRGKKPDAAP